MGVYGLSSLIKTCMNSYTDHVDLTKGGINGDKTIIVVDGNAFAYFYLIEEKDNMISAYSCDYNRLSLKLISWIRKCQQANVELVFIFDGVINDDKLRVKLKRLSNQAIEVYQKVNYINHKTDDEPMPRFNNILPLFMIDCIIEACNLCNVSTFIAKSEADQVLALFAKAINATAILSNDSDFLIYDIDNVGLILSDGYGFAEDGSMHAYIIRRHKLARILGLSVNNLYFIPALVGNDISNKQHLREIQQLLLRGRPSNNLNSSKNHKNNSDIKRKKKKAKNNNSNNSTIIENEKDVVDDNCKEYFAIIESIISSKTNDDNESWHNYSALKMITNAVALLKKAEQHVYSTNNNMTNITNQKCKPTIPLSPEDLIAFMLNITVNQVNDNNCHDDVTQHLVSILLAVFRYLYNYTS